MRLPRTGDEVVVVTGVAEALLSRPSASVAGDAGALAMCTATGGAAVRVLVAEGACDVSSAIPARRFPGAACCVGKTDGLRDNEAACESMAARKEEEEDAMAAERSGTGSATMRNE